MITFKIYTLRTSPEISFYIDIICSVGRRLDWHCVGRRFVYHRGQAYCIFQLARCEYRPTNFTPCYDLIHPLIFIMLMSMTFYFIFRNNPSLVVTCDKGLTFSPAENVFICQKKNHFQVQFFITAVIFN